MLRKLIWLLIFLFTASSLNVQAESRCQRKAGKEKIEFHGKMDAIEMKYVSIRQALVDEGIFHFHDKAERDSVRKSIERLVTAARIPEKREVWSLYIDSFLDAAIEKGKASGNCSSFGSLNKRSMASRSELTKHLRALNRSIANRLAISSLGPDEGLAILAVASTGYAEAIHLSRRGKINDYFVIGPLANEQYFQVIKLKAGTHIWSKIKISGGRSYKYYDFTDRDMVIEIQPGKLNYTGVFTFKRQGESGADARIDDRTAIVMQIFEAQFPELLGKYPLVNGLDPDDTFLEFYQAEKTSPVEE